MRARITIGAIGATAVLIAAAVAMAAPAVQTYDPQVSNKAKPKLDKRKFKKSEISIAATVADQADPEGMPPVANRVQFAFNKKNVKIDTKQAGYCKQSDLENTTTDDAIAKCPKAVVGDGSVSAALPFGPGGAPVYFDGDVVIFNAKNQMLIHARIGPPLNVTLVIPSRVKNKSTYDISVPPIAGGVGAFNAFEATFKKGKYIQARCKTKKMDSTFIADFDDAPRAKIKAKQTCKRKRKRS